MDRPRGPSRDRSALTARPGDVPPDRIPVPGRQTLGLEPARDTLLYVPNGLQFGQPAPLILLLHGAGGEAAGGLSLLLPLADTYKLVLAAPSSRGSTWDGIRGDYGPDVEVINRAMERIFNLVFVDPHRVAVGGFSDGASYALGLGLANGDLFSKVIAFSPGFVPPAPRVGKPGIFVSHGDGDDVLPIDRTSRRLVPALEQDGYYVSYREFKGPHTVPAGIAQEAIDWLEWKG
jgi:phospholipase/carboxylesterase